MLFILSISSHCFALGFSKHLKLLQNDSYQYQWRLYSLIINRLSTIVYDIVYFEHKPSWLCFRLFQNTSYQRRLYSLIINWLSTMVWIVHFEYKLSWLRFGILKNDSYQWRLYSLIINDHSFSSNTYKIDYKRSFPIIY